MPTRFRKVRKQRGSRYHGWGQVGQHRKTGGKGGSGKAGLRKHKWTWSVKYAAECPDKGFNPPSRIKSSSLINISQLDDICRGLSGGKTKMPTVNLLEMGYDKLLGQGKVTKAYKIIIDRCSKSAKKKIEDAGGSVELG